MKLLTTQEAAKKLGVTVSRVQVLIADHRLPAQKLGRDFFVREDDLRLVGARTAGRTPARLQLDYWTAFVTFLGKKRIFPSPPSPKAERSMIIETMRGSRLAASIHVKDAQLWVDLTFARTAKKYFDRLENEKDAIEKDMGQELEWVPRSEKAESWILIRTAADPADRSDWNRQHVWLANNLEKFSEAFRPRIMR